MSIFQSYNTSSVGIGNANLTPKTITFISDRVRIPDNLFVTGISVDLNGPPDAGGRFSDVFRGTYQGRDVAVKRLRVRSPREEKAELHQRFYQEALIWKDLRHQRILEFIGIDRDEFMNNDTMCMISPWMSKGTLTHYLQYEGAAPINHKLIMMDISSGLLFLHTLTPPLAHGDLHGSNILLDNDCRALLGDFGLTARTNDASEQREWAGALRWLSPELLHLKGDPPLKTTSGDVFAFGRICWSIFTRHIPFPTVSSTWALIYKIISNVHPERPNQNDCFGAVLHHEMWTLISQCWDVDATVRPHIDEICRTLEGMVVDYHPPSLFISNVTTGDSDAAVAHGAFSEVFRGTYQGQDVAIKRFRVYLLDYSENEKLYKRFYREARTWQQLRHPRILAFVGIDEEALRDKQALCIVSPWMSQGTLMEYLDQVGDAPIDHHLLLTDVLSGLNHLHSKSLAHGDLHGSNVYVSDRGQAMLGDFGLTTIADVKSVTTTINRAGAIRWMSPELLFNSTCKTMSGDIFSFGRICLSVYTRHAPFHEISQDLALVMKITSNQHPNKPNQHDCFGVLFPDELWELVLRCWAPDPATRPTCLEVIREHNQIFRLHLPPALLLNGVTLSQDVPVAWGDAADVFQGTYQGQAVVIKRLRFSQCHDSARDNNKRTQLYREALARRQFRHPRILPLLGIDGDALNINGSLGIVSPWMMNGTLAQHISNMDNSHIQHQALLTDVALGLQYLHSEQYAHGDLTALNILIDNNGRLLLSGFLLAAPTETMHLNASTTIDSAGTLRWMAPELLLEDREMKSRKTTSSDIFAFGRMCLYVYTRQRPYHNISSELMVLRKVMRHEFPDGPMMDECHGTAMPDPLWEMVLRCWDKDPKARPTIDDIVTELGEMNFKDQRDSILPSKEGDLGVQPLIEEVVTQLDEMRCEPRSGLSKAPARTVGALEATGGQD